MLNSQLARHFMAETTQNGMSSADGGDVRDNTHGGTAEQWRGLAPALFSRTTMPDLFTLNTLWTMCLPLTWAGLRTPSSETSPRTLCKLEQQQRREQPGAAVQAPAPAPAACAREPYVLRSRHGFPDVVHLFHRYLLPPDQLAFVHVPYSHAVPFVPQI